MTKEPAHQKPASRELFLGVDGGGTKTHIIIIDDTGRIVAEAWNGPSNPLRVGIETSVKHILWAVNSACDEIVRSPNDIVSSVMGLAGVRRADLRARIRRRLAERLGYSEIEVCTDAEIALFAATEGEAGIVVIAGTGSVCFGRNKTGKAALSGGWGPIAGDEGGGVSIARQALQAIAKASDGRGRPTKLSAIAAEYFRASRAEDLIVAIYSPQMDYRRLAGFAKHVSEVAKEGDEIALEIMSVAGFELGLAAYAVIRQLRLENEAVPIGLVGGVFDAGKIITGPLLATVHSYAPHAYLKRPALSPAEAAAKLAIAKRYHSPSR